MKWPPHSRVLNHLTKQQEKNNSDLGKLTADTKVTTMETRSDDGSTCPFMMLQYVYTSSGEKVGVLWDSASDTNYCTNEVAERLKLKGEPFTLVINAITGIKTVVETMRYIC